MTRLQKKVVRVITFFLHTESSKPLFQKLEILNFDQLKNQLTILFMIDLFNNKLPHNFRDIYIMNSQLHSYATRPSNNIHKRYSIKFTGTKFWNSIQ